MTTVADLSAAFDARYPPQWAADWDRVGLVLGEPTAQVERVLLAVDCTPQTALQARDGGFQALVVHHPLMLRGVSTVAPTTWTGRIVHDLIGGGVALFVVHTNADVANPGVSDALAHALGLSDLRPLRPATGAAAGSEVAGIAGRGLGRIGTLPETVTLREFVSLAAAALPATAWGVRAAGDPDRPVRTVAVCGGAGGDALADAEAAGVDAYLTADLRHHPAADQVARGGPALLDAAHWATEWPWLADAATIPTALGLTAEVSTIVTDPWTVHAGVKESS